MKKAIISGSTGLLGRALVKLLCSKGIELLCLGRKELDQRSCKEIFGSSVTYLCLPMERILDLKRNCEEVKWFADNCCVFYNLAWSGSESLTDGTFRNQLENVSNSANAVTAAIEVGCQKFVNAGTIEETFADTWFRNSSVEFNSTQLNYSLAKIAARDMCKIVAYLNKIDYVHTRLSVPLDFTLKKGSYIANTLKKISNNMKYQKPTNTQLFDIISVEDVAKAYLLIGHYGKNKADYYIGSSRPATLEQFFNAFDDLLKTKKRKNKKKFFSDNNSFFSYSKLKNDTGFSPSNVFEDILRESF